MTVLIQLSSRLSRGIDRNHYLVPPGGIEGPRIQIQKLNCVHHRATLVSYGGMREEGSRMVPKHHWQELKGEVDRDRMHGRNGIIGKFRGMG